MRKTAFQRELKRTKLQEAWSVAAAAQRQRDIVASNAMKHIHQLELRIDIMRSQRERLFALVRTLRRELRKGAR